MRIKTLPLILALSLALLSGIANGQSVYISGPSSSDVGQTEIYWANWDFTPDEGEFNWWVDGGDTVYPDPNWYSYTSCRVNWSTGGQGLVWYSYTTYDNYWEENFPVDVNSPTPIPDPPVLNNATNITATSFTVSWSSVPSATSYRVEVTADPTNWGNLAYENFSTTAISDNVTGLTGGTTYYYRVRAFNEAGGSGYSMGENVLTLPDAPEAYYASNIGVNSFTANWSSVTGATSGYRLDVSTTSSFSSFVTGYNNLTVSGISQTVTGLSPGTNYYYRVRAVGDAGTSANSNTRSVLMSPAAPSVYSASNFTASSFTANWSSVATATSYRLDVSSQSTFSSFITGYSDLSVTGTSQSITGLSVGTTYYYRVRAVNASGASYNSATQSALTVPAAPTATYATLITTNSFHANWTSVPSATGYRLDVSTASAFSSFVSGYQDLSAVQAQNVTGLSPGTYYYYRVRAVNGSGVSVSSNTETVVTVPPAPTAIDATDVTTSSFTANWSSAPTAWGYKLDVSTTSTFSDIVTGYNDLWVDGTSQSVTGLSEGTVYYYRVRADNAGGTSTDSNTKSVVTLPGSPTANDPTDFTTTSFTANWTSVPSATGYQLDVSTISTFPDFVPGYNSLPVAGTSYNVTGLSAGTGYYYRIRAVNASGASQDSNMEGGMTLPEAPTPTASNITASSFTISWPSLNSTYQLDVSTVSTFSSFVTGYNNLTVFSPSKSVTGLSAGTTYYYRVRAVNESGSSANSETGSVVTIPTTPTASNATSIATNSFTANWNSAQSATSYRLDVSIDGFSTFVPGYNDMPVTGTSQGVTGLSGGTTYYYRVRAVNGSGTSANSNTVSVFTIPEPPGVSNATNITASSFTANWASSTGASSYKLDVSTNSGFSNFVTGYQDLTVSTTSRNVTNLLAGGTYYYRVRAVNGSGASAASNTETVALPFPAPVATSASSVTVNSFVANWNPSEGAANYRLDVSVNSDFSTLVDIYNDLSVTGTSINVSGLSANTTYHYRVRAENANGVSSSSNTISVLLLTDAPTATAASDITPDSFTANWNSVAGATGYRLDVSTSSSFASYVTGYNNLQVTGTSQGVTWLDSETPYYFRVRALNATGSSANSNTISVTSGQDQNYIRTIDVLAEGMTTSSQVESAATGDQLTQYSFFDGLGRPMQNVTREGSPSGNDVVQPIVYDEFGREYRKYLPFVADESSGWFKEDVINATTGAYQNAALDFYNDASDAIADDPTPWAQTKFEPSPLNRVLKQGAPGTTWQPDTNPYATTLDHSVKYDYQSNQATEVLLWTYTLPTPTYPFGQVSASTGITPNNYSVNELYKTLTKDEDQHEVIEFRDKQDRVILKKVQGPNNTWAQTYYIYDDFGSLVCVLQPEGVKNINDYFNADDANKEIFLGRWAFRYVYDGRKRMTIKQVPGADPVYMVYDNRDRLVLTQDGNQRNITPTKEWTFTRYDALNRPVLTGKYESNDDLATMQSAVNSFYDNLASGQAWYDSYIGSATGNALGYDDKSFPRVSSESSYHTATYYDLYDSYIAPAGYTYLNESLPGQESAALTSVKGQVTGSKVKNLSSGTWLRTVSYYDDRYRVIQTVGDHQKGTTRTSNVYDFAGKILISKRTYVVNSATTTIKETYAYDPVGRVVNIKHSMNGGPDVMIVKNEYNELGQLIDKNLHSTDGGTTFMQSVDHRYNIRGWLTKINEADVSGLAGGDPGYDYFGMELDYDNAVSGLSSTPAFNGNISAIQWSKGNGESVGKQAYAYTYDPMNRLKEASHFDYEGVAWTGNNRSFQEKIHAYDLNGNIMKLSRREFGGMLMDSLWYGYTGNRLNYVHDYGNQTEGFVNTNTGTDDYDYDFNGNLDKDRNKGLLTKGDIRYNYLNLPEEVIKGTESIKYIYDATGRKLAQEVYSNNGGTLVKTTDYIGELVYENNNLQFAQTSDGRVLPDGGGWEYQYHIKDHLGNVRVTFTTKPQSPASAPANLESGTANSGEGVFGNYTSTTFDLVDHTDAGTVYQNVQWLNGGPSGRVGLTKSLSVMPGDRVSVTAYAKYMNLSDGGNTNVFATALATAFGVSSASTGEQLKLYNGLNNYGLAVAGGDHPDDDDTAPKAFVTILLFDRNYNLLDAAWDQITTDLEQVSATQKEPFAYPLSKEVVVHEPGFAFIFVSNEHPTYVDVYFDDVEVTHTPSSIVSASDYYPFGATFNSYSRENSVKNRYLYNQGTGEKTFLTERVVDLDLSVDLSKYRTYDYLTGRWWQIDPLADEADFTSLTPYNYSFNNPIRYNDAYGDCPICIPLIWALAEAVTAVAEGATVAAGGTAVAVGAAGLIANAPAGASPAGAYTPAVGFAMSSSSAGELSSPYFLNSESKTKQPDQAALQRGRDNEKKALQEEGLTKNNKTKTVIDPKTGKEVKVKPDGDNETTVGEVKDTKKVSNTRQIRGEREVAKQEGKELKIITGEKTKVSKTIPQSEVVKKSYLGPQE